MNGLSQILLIIGFIWGMAFWRIPLWVSTVLVALLLFIFHQLEWMGTAAWLGGTALLLISLPINVSKFRRQLFMDSFFYWFKKALPPMSDTEQAAIEAGDLGWEKALFQGRPQYADLLKLPSNKLTKEEQEFLNQQVETLCEMLNDWKIVHENSDLPSNVWQYLKEQKFFGMIIPRKYQGLEFSAQAHSAVITKIASRSLSTAVTVMVPNALGPAELLLEYGTLEQKEYYLPRLARGEEIPCFALTGPEAGSDAGSIPDKGIVCKGKYAGKEVIGIRLSFDKRYITLAPVATLIGVAFKLFDPEKLIGDKTEIGITLCLIPANLPGLEKGTRHFPLNQAFMNGPIRAKDIFIPLNWIIGGEKMAGQGWKMLMECLAAGRGISLPALSTASGMVATRMTSAYACIRQQFNTALINFEGVEEALARIVGHTYLLEATRQFIANAVENKHRPAVATAISKYQLTELARKVVNDAMDIHGGRAIMLGPSNYLARGYQAIPISITVEGANILTRNLIIFGQGIIRCHPYIKQEMMIAKSFEANAEQALREFDKICMKHIGYTLSNFARSLFYSLTTIKVPFYTPNTNSSYYFRRLAGLSAGLAACSDIAMLILGGELKRKERISARMGDVLSQLYLASACLKFYASKPPVKDEELVLNWAMQTCFYKAQEALYGLFDNFPQPLIASLLKRFIFPFGRKFQPPSDSLAKKIVKIVAAPSEFRENITQLCYIGKSSDDASGLMEVTFSKKHLAKEAIAKILIAIKNKEIDKNLTLEQQIQAAFTKKIINESEAALVQDYEVHRKKAIAVDEFPTDYALGSKVQ